MVVSILESLSGTFRRTAISNPQIGAQIRDCQQYVTTVTSSSGSTLRLLCNATKIKITAVTARASIRIFLPASSNSNALEKTAQSIHKFFHGIIPL